MVVKSERGRRRYVVFSVSPGTTKEGLIRRAESVCCGKNVPYFIQCTAGMAVVRCAPNEIERIIEIMVQIDPDSESLLTSGTLRTIRDKYPELKVPKKH